MILAGGPTEDEELLGREWRLRLVDLRRPARRASEEGEHSGICDEDGGTALELRVV